MERRSPTQFTKIFLLLPFTGLLLQGCEPIVPSIEVPTEDMFVDYNINAYESVASGGAAWFYQSSNYRNEPLDAINALDRSTVELTGGESCDIDVNNDTYFMETLQKQTQDLKQDPRYWLLFSTSITWYIVSELNMSVLGPTLSTSLPPLATGDEVSFSFHRAAGEVLQSSVTIGEYPVITSPTNNAVFANDVQDIAVAWNALVDSTVPVLLYVGLRCTTNDMSATGDEFLQLAALTYDAEHYHLVGVEVELPGGTTDYVITRSELMEKMVVPDGVTQCAGGVSLSYDSRGTLAPEFKGGKIVVTHNAQRVGFVLNL